MEVEDCNEVDNNMEGDGEVGICDDDDGEILDGLTTNRGELKIRTSEDHPRPRVR